MVEETGRNEDPIKETLRQLLEELKNAKSEEEIELIEKKIELLEDMIEKKGRKKKVELKTESDVPEVKGIMDALGMVKEKEYKKTDTGSDAQEVKEIMDALAESLPKIMDSLMGPLKELLNELYNPERAEMLGKNIATFYKEMVGAGMEPDKAFELTKEYMESINVVKSLLETLTKGGKKGSGINIVTKT